MADFSPRTSLVALILLLLIVASGLPGIGASLLLGIAYALIIGNSFQVRTHWASGIILKTSIVLLGLSINLLEVYETAKSSFFITFITIGFALVVGALLGKLFKVDQSLAFLISSGTAICGGSAIAAVAPAIKAQPGHVIVSITVVFLLNAASLLLFPQIGHWLALEQIEFGLWAALAIHDTSSVVGAAGSYGSEALSVATTAKLARALWIVPLVLLASTIFHQGSRKISIPLFIVFFLVASTITSVFQLPAVIIEWIPTLAKTGMAISLFLIGAGFSQSTLSTVQWSALWQGIFLWILVSLFSLGLIYYL